MSTKQYIPVNKIFIQRSRIFTLWILLVAIKQVRQKLARKKLNSSKVDNEDTTKVHGANIRFTKTNGGKVNFGFLPAAEFYLPIAIAVYDLYVYRKYGRRLFKILPAGLQVYQLFFGIFCIAPLVESFIPRDWANPTKEQQKEQKKDNLIYKLPLYLWAFFEFQRTFQTISVAFGRKSHFISTKNKIFLLVQLGLLNGAIGINSSHELIHKSKKLDKFLGYFLLLNVNYLHWGEEHLTGHHKNVATPQDPASSRFNESFYQFFPRTLIGSFRSAYSIEMQRLLEKDIKNGVSPDAKFMRVDNRMFWNVVSPFIYFSIIAKVTGGGIKAVAGLYFQSLIAAWMLEVINYIEHYGLSRQKLPSGEYEQVDPTHSWNSPDRVSNAILFKLQRHSDHHTFSKRPYQLLRNFKESPQLPTGYPGMFILALCPPAFFWVMNPLVKAHEANKKRLLDTVKDGKNSYTFSKSEEFKQIESQAKNKVILFLVTVAGFAFVPLYHGMIG